MKCIGIIPARGGSKRLPRKNVADFLGSPIITYTIRAAQESGVFARLVVSTEDAATAEVAHGAGAMVMNRPPELATDTSGVLDVCLHVLDEEERAGRCYDVICCLYATSPLRNAEDIRNTVAPVAAGECDFCAAVCSYNMPPYQALIADGETGLRYMWPDLATLRAQDLPDFLADNGSTYAARVSALRRDRSFMGKGLRGYRMPKIRSVDIDLQEDLDMARGIGRELLP